MPKKEPKGIGGKKVVLKPRRKHGKKIIVEPVPQSKITALATALSEVLGTDAVHRCADSDRGTPRLFVPSGLKELDRLLDRDRRGWPVGRIVEVYGAEATCKTALGYSLIAAAQKMGGDGILYPCEGEYDEWLAGRYGVDLNRLILGDSETVEKVFGSFHQTMRVVGRTGLLVGMIDSIAGLNTEAELEELEATGTIRRDRSAQLRAQMLSSSFRKIAPIVARTNTILFCVNQVRTTDGGPHGGAAQKKPPGGFALRFHASIRLQLDMMGKYKRTTKGVQRIGGVKLRATSVKNRLSTPFEECNFRLDYENGLLPESKK